MEKRDNLDFFLSIMHQNYNLVQKVVSNEKLRLLAHESMHCCYSPLYIRFFHILYVIRTISFRIIFLTIERKFIDFDWSIYTFQLEDLLEKLFSFYVANVILLERRDVVILRHFNILLNNTQNSIISFSSVFYSNCSDLIGYSFESLSYFEVSCSDLLVKFSDTIVPICGYLGLLLKKDNVSIKEYSLVIKSFILAKNDMFSGFDFFFIMSMIFF